MQTFQHYLFVLERSYVCYYITCMTVPRRLSLWPWFINHFKKGDYPAELAEDLQSYDEIKFLCPE